MTTADAGSLPHIRIEAENEWAWCGDRRLELTHRAFAVLRHLVENPHRLITKDDLLTAVWRDAVVSEASLTSCIRDLRKQLGDSSSAPRYIQINGLGPVEEVRDKIFQALDASAGVRTQ